MSVSRLAALELAFQDLPEIDALSHPVLDAKNISVDCLRLDKAHPFVSGNKWYKLKHHLIAAIQQDKASLLSFGGAFSNHLHALAYAGQSLGLPTLGLVRGEAPRELSPTLQDCDRWGMQLQWLARDQYRDAATLANYDALRSRYPDAFLIPEGGEGELGGHGVQELFAQLYHEGLMSYDLIVCAVGSGTTMAGMILGCAGRAQVLGFSALKGAYDLEQRVEKAFGAQSAQGNWQICHDYHFGGFAKGHPRLFDFISDVHKKSDLLLDPVYTGKALYGLIEWSLQGRIGRNSRVLFIHSGGLQGWRGMVKHVPDELTLTGLAGPVVGYNH